MALETPSQAIGRIDVSQLVGRPDTDIVTPRATAALTDAFRQGIITADDIVSRIGEAGQTKKKAELQMAQEFVSPEAQALRQQQLAAGTAQGALSQAQAQAGLGMVDPAAELQAAQIEQQKILIQYPAIAYFQKLAPAAGITEPKLPDGSPDYAQMEKIGAELAVHQARKGEAAAQLENITTQDSADGSTLFARTKQGEFVDPATVQRLRAQATATFSRPGTAQTAPAAAVPAMTPQVEARSTEDINAVRARLAGEFGADTMAAMPEDHVRRLASSQASEVVTPRFAPAAPGPGTAAPGARVAGGISLGPPRPTGIKGPTEAQQRAQLALARFSQAGDMQAALAEAGYDPTSIGSWMSGMLPQVLKTGDRKQYEAAVDAWSQGLLRLESGAAISRQEKDWYGRAFFPQVRDPETVVLAKEAMRHDIERMVAEIAQQGGVVSPESAEQAARIYERAGALATGTARPSADVSTGGNIRGAGQFSGGRPQTGAAPTITLPSGKVVRRNAQGVFEEVR